MSAPKFMGFIESDETLWKRFLRERKHEIDLLNTIMETRDMYAAGSRAANACDLMTLQMMQVYISPTSCERYRQLSPEAEDRMRAGTQCSWLSTVECAMLRALEGVVASTGYDDRLHYFNEFLNLLYERWKIVDDNGLVDWQH